MFDSIINDYPIGTNWRWEHGKIRISYRPDWSESMPFVSYFRGTAGRHFTSLQAAAQYFNVPLDKAHKS